MNERISATPQAPTSNNAALSVNDIALPIKRMLRMQLKEFVHHIEDAEDGFAVTDQLIRTSTILERRIA
jgi:hypothetical protein